jgi:hypothetical protein
MTNIQAAKEALFQQSCSFFFLLQEVPSYYTMD